MTTNNQTSQKMCKYCNRNTNFVESFVLDNQWSPFWNVELSKKSWRCKFTLLQGKKCALKTLILILHTLQTLQLS